MGLAALSMFIYAGVQDVSSSNILEDILGVLAFASPAIVGGYLVWRLPGNTVGWALAGFGVTFALGVAGETLSGTGNPLAPFGAWLASWMWAASTFLILVVLPLRFPDGMLPFSRFRWVTPTAAFGLVLVILGNTMRELLTLPMAVSGITVSIGLGLLGAAVAGAVFASVSRFRRSKGVERQQMKVFAAALVFAVLVNASAIAITGMGNEVVGNAVFATSVLVLMASIAVAVLRFRLYEFDRIISRTVTYALLVLILGSVYAMGAVWLPTRLAGQESPLFVAGSTLAAAALFTPIRRVVMGWVDRRFNRSSYDAELVADAFSARLRDQVDANRLAADWADVVGSTLEPSVVGVWVRDDAEG
jgi:hypothetical protein